MKPLNHSLQKIILIFLGVILFSNLALFPCTIAVVSGKATPDGSPLLWKNRDTYSPANKIVFLKGEKYGFIGNINLEDENMDSIWAGLNTEGFAIINALTRDLLEDDQEEVENGRFMKLALGECADVPEFELLLGSTNTTRKVAAIFGVIDAKGNAAFFETSNSSFVKFDANDPRVAPQGFIIRTNFAYTSLPEKEGGGFIRFERANKLFQSAAAEGRLDGRFILQDVARDLANDKIRSYPFEAKILSPVKFPSYINTNDTINRNTTVSSFLFHGTADPEKPFLSTMWVLLGQPICTVSVPLWPLAGEVPEDVKGETAAPINDLAIKMVEYLYPDRRGHMEQYLNITRLLEFDEQSIMSQILKIESSIFMSVHNRIQRWKEKKPGDKEIINFQNNTALLVTRSLKRALMNLMPDN